MKGARGRPRAAKVQKVAEVEDEEPVDEDVEESADQQHIRCGVKHALRLHEALACLEGRNARSAESEHA